MIDRVERIQPRYLDDSLEKRIADETFDGYKNKLKGRLFGLLCEREKNGEWEKFLDSIILELRGLGANSINWWPLMGKLGVLRYLSYEYFRKTIFECMNLIGKLDIPDELS
jgi:hypothetical protein